MSVKKNVTVPEGSSAIRPPSASSVWKFAGLEAARPVLGRPTSGADPQLCGRKADALFENIQPRSISCSSTSRDWEQRDRVCTDGDPNGIFTSLSGGMFSAMVDPLGRSSSMVSAEGLRRLANAYDVSTPTLDAIADAIIARTTLTDGEYQRGAVMELVAFILQDQAVLAVLAEGTRVRDDVLKQMAELIASDPPATVPEWDLVQIVIEDIQSILNRPEPKETTK